MLFFACLVAIIVSCIATGHYDHHDDHDDKHHYHYQPYGFGYDIHDAHGNKQWRHEKSSHAHAVEGSYGYKDKYGNWREVNYVADKNGFRAHVKTNEPGTAPKDPASVKMDANPDPHLHRHHGGYSHGHGHDDYKHAAASNQLPVLMPVYKVSSADAADNE